MKKLSFFLLIAAIAPILISFGGEAGYGHKLKYGSTELYYTDKVTKKEAKALGDYLVETKFTEGDEKITVQLTKEGDVYQFRMVVKESYLDDAEYDAIAASYAYSISIDVFDGKEVEIHFCDNKLVTKKVVEMDKGTGVDVVMDMLEFDGTEIEYDKTVTKSEVKALGNYLVKEGFTDGTRKSVRFVFDDDAYTFSMVVSEENAYDAEYEEIARNFAIAMSTDLFDGAAVGIWLCDEYFLPYTYVGMDYIDIAYDDYEKLEMIEFDGTEIEYENSFSKSEVTVLGNYLVKVGFADGIKKSVQLLFWYETYIFAIIVNEETANDAEYQEKSRSFANALSTDLFDGAAVEIWLCDESLLPYFYVGKNYVNKAVFDYVEMEKLEFDGMEIKYDNSVTNAEVNVLGNYFVAQGFIDGTLKSVAFYSLYDTYILSINVSEETAYDAEYQEKSRSFANAMSTDLFDGADVEIQLCDEYSLPYAKIGKNYIEIVLGDDENMSMKEFAGTKIGYDKSIAKCELNALGKYLVKEGFADGTKKSIQFVKKFDVYVIRMIISEETVDDAKYKEIANIFTNLMSTDLFKGIAIEIHLCDESFNPYGYVKLSE